MRTFSCCKNNDVKTMEKMQQLEALKAAPKFVQEVFYIGVADKQNERVQSQLLDESIDRFTERVTNNFSDKQYRDLMKNDLDRFNDYNLDTEDREYICGFYEKIMDAIELESSDGVLNNWLYDF
ncbi:hypothetical protein GCM10023210_13880 [Chryseobacterium ginsengisoli]|uniref:DUF4844 domain-containing protein n=2 Tax=Chryseobacterium ginsengisoli TaxID=363853 RepID=A0ABP9M4X1_9FLAO